MSLAAVPNLESELDGLYALPLEQFAKARNDLWPGDFVKAHQDDVAAATVRALKKPSTVAWAANRLARDQPKQVDALLQASERLRDAQQRSLAGKSSADEVDEAAAAEREAVRALLASARTALGARATAPLLERLSQTLRAAAIDGAARTLLQRGRLTEELKAPGSDRSKRSRRRAGGATRSLAPPANASPHCARRHGGWTPRPASPSRPLRMLRERRPSWATRLARNGPKRSGQPRSSPTRKPTSANAARS